MSQRDIFSQMINEAEQFPALTNMDTHVHSPYSSCCEDITYEILRKKAKEHNIQYAITDHSSHLYFPEDEVWSFWILSDDEFKAYFKKHHFNGRKRVEDYIKKTRANAPFVGIEIDFFPDGTVIFDDDLLPEFDFIVGAVHFLPTVRNMDSYTNIMKQFKYVSECVICSGIINSLAHPFRVLAHNDIPVDDELIDWVVSHCAKQNIALELNSHYQFPDCDYRMIKAAKKHDAKIVYASDAHTVREFADFTYHEKIMNQLN